MNSSNLQLGDFVSNIEQPLLLTNYLKWDIINWDISKWNEILGNENLVFRYGWYAKTQNPQWEKMTPLINGTFKDLQSFSQIDRWLYFDYKYMNEWLLGAEELREKIHFEDLGLNNVTVNESTIWIGTKGAHTPCHVDTYGCNVVVQIYGQKLWLLFDPEENLKATRVPYEESTIYSKFNFFSPSNLADFEGIHKTKLIILKPGDVLIIPNKWWHYVECLDTSISINTWLPLQQDHHERKNECLIQLLMGSLLHNLDGKIPNSILNPNSYDTLKQPLQEGINLFNEILKLPVTENQKYEDNKKIQIFDVLKKNLGLKEIENITKEDLNQFLEKQSKRFSEYVAYKEKQEEEETLKKIIYAVTHPDVIDLILKKIVEK